MAVSQPDSPKRGRVMSFGSNKSGEKTHKTHKSSSSGHDLEPTPSRDSHRMRTHADPTLAISEMQPSAMALEKSNLESLRGLQFKDVYGKPITEPDLSNPTRYRYERPLDTIRSFEAAIEGSYSTRRTSYAGPDDSSRRNSYFADRGGGNHYNRGYSEQGNYYNGRGNYSRPDSYSESYAGPSHNNHSNYGHQPPRAPRHGPRMNSDQMAYGNGIQPPYAQNGSYPGYDSGSGSGGSGSYSADQLANYQTDPSSVNSSVDGLQQGYHQGQQKPDEQAIAESYGLSGFGPDPQLNYQQPSSSAYPNGQHNYNSPAFAPGVPPKDLPVTGTRPANKGPNVTRKQIPAKSPAAAAPPAKEKRKSWFKRLSKT